jgi:preprotein translocase subunit SecA
VLEYDDVMNTQRSVIYKQRQQVLDGEDLANTIDGMLHHVIDSELEETYASPDYETDAQRIAALNEKFGNIYFAKGALTEDKNKEAVRARLYELFKETYARREAEFGSETMREIERVVMLRVVDEYWMDNIDAMDDLKQGIRLRAYGQTDPVVAYKREGFAMFDAMIGAIREETVRRLYLVRLRTNEEVRRTQVAKITGTGGSDNTVKKQPVKKVKIGANDPCPCGSGKKYKHCCRDKDDAK